MRFLRTLTLSFFPLIAFGQASNVDWRFAQPGATLVGGVRVDALLQSSILNTVIEQATAKDPMTSAMVGMMRGALSGVSEIRFSMLDVGSGKEPEVLTLVTGHLDDAAAAALTQGKKMVHRLDSNTLLIGDADAIAESIRRLGEPPLAIKNPGLERGKALADYDLWIAGSLPDLPMTAALTGMLKGLSVGLSLRDDLRLEVALDTPSVEVAEDMVRQVRKSQHDQPDLASSLLTDVDGTTARFRVTVEKKVVMQGIQQAIAGGALSSLGSSTALPTPKFKQKEPERTTVRIYGLDEGTREFTPDPAH